MNQGRLDREVRSFCIKNLRLRLSTQTQTTKKECINYDGYIFILQR